MKIFKQLLIVTLLFSQVIVASADWKGHYKLTVEHKKDKSLNVRYVTFEETNDHNYQEKYSHFDSYIVYRSHTMDSDSPVTQNSESVDTGNNVQTVDTAFLHNENNNKVYCEIEDGIPKMGDNAWKGYLLSQKIIGDLKKGKLRVKVSY